MSVVNPLDLSGRTILVTGASSGIGRETAILLSQLSAKVVLSGRDAKRLQETREQLHGDAHSVTAYDLNLLDEIPAWLKNVTAESGPLHGLVHSAGVHATIPLRVLSAQRIDEIMKVNVSTAIMLAKALRQKSCLAADCSLVFLTSAAGLVGSPGLAAYSASKAALIGLTRSLALELAGDGMRVNCVAPGFVKSAMLDRHIQVLSVEQLKALEASFPLGFGTPRDVAYAIAFLLAGTGRWITGSTVVVDGGYTIH